jgi:hypothetical protein
MAYVQSAAAVNASRRRSARVGTDPIASYRYATIVAASFVAGLALFLAVPAFMQLQADSFRDLFLGRWILEHGLPHREAIAIANRGGGWVDQQWLSDVLAYGTWKLGGYQGLAVLNASAFAAAYGLLACLMRRRGASVAVAISFAPFAMVSAFTLVFIRAQMLVLPLFIGVLWLCLEDSKEERFQRRTLLIAPLLVLWANLHGSVLLAVVMATAYAVYRALHLIGRGDGRSAVRYAGLAIACSMTLLATPYGASVFQYYTQFVGNKAMGAADFEWDPPAFPTLGFFQFAVPLGMACFGAILGWSRGRRPSIVVTAAVVITAAAAATAMRNNVWLGMIAALLVAETAGSWIATREYSASFLRLLALLAVSMGAIGVGRLALEGNQRFEVLAPERAIKSASAYAGTHPCARVLADITSVSALLWHYPWMAGRVGFDGRIEVYEPSALLQWVDFQAATGPQSLRLARGYAILMASSRSPMLVRELAGLRTDSALGRGPRGISVLNQAARNAGCQRRGQA